MKTSPETKTLNAIKKFYAKRLRMPTYSEIAELIGVSSKESAYRQVQKLITAKLLRKDSQGKLLPLRESITATPTVVPVNTGTSLQIVTQRQQNSGLGNKHNNIGISTYEEIGLPMLGVVEAGFPSETEQQELDMVSLDQWLVHNPDSSFVLQVKGDSMIEAGIHSGDHVIADTKQQAKLGDIVIARLDGGVTMKYLRQKGNLLYLEPANKYLEDMYPESELSVQAVVTAVIRKFR